MLKFRRFWRVWGFPLITHLSAPRLAAVVVDLSEDLRNREDLSLDHLLKISRIVGEHHGP
jgi:hypothetical protein